MVTKIAKNGRVVTAAMIIGASSLVSRLVGLLRERVLTTTFGAGDVFDAFVAAFRIPDLFFNLVVLGALSAAFIPLFMGKLVKGKKGEEEAFGFAVSVLNLIVIVVGVLGLIFFVLAPWLMPLIVPGFSGEKLQLAVTLSRIMILQPMFLGISFVLSGILNSFKRFVVYAMAPILYNVGIIIGVVWLVPMLGVAGLGWGVVLGAIMHMLIQLPSVLSVGFRWQAKIEWSSDDLKKLWKMMVPRVVGLAAMQVNLFTVAIIGSGLAAGSITVFHLANNLQYLPVGIFGIAFASAAFPTLAEQAARKDKKAFLGTLTRSFRYILFFVVPTALFFFLLRAQMVRVLFGDGAFDWEDTILTFETFGWLIISIFAQATIPLLARAFYVQHDTKAPVIFSVFSMIINVVLALVLAPRMGVQGLAVAFSVSAIINMVLLLGALHWRYQGFNDREVLVSMLKVTMAALVAGAVVQILKYPISAMVDMQRFWGVMTQLIGAGLGGAIVYVVVAWLLKSEELTVLRRYISGRGKVELASGTDTSRFEGLLD